MSALQQPRKMSSVDLVGFCMGCHYAHIQSEVVSRDGRLWCLETESLVERFTRPVSMVVPEESKEPVQKQAMDEVVRIAIMDMAFHAGIDLTKNKSALEEIAQRFCALLVESEQS